MTKADKQFFYFILDIVLCTLDIFNPSNHPTIQPFNQFTKLPNYQFTN